VASHALIVTYHAVEPGPAPLCVDPGRFRAHLSCLAEVGATVLTVAELADRFRQDDLPERAVALTFDDGFASVARVAAPLMAEHGFRGTVFAIAGLLGGQSDWDTQPARAPRRPLATAAELSQLAADGFEIGSHTMSHRPLSEVPAQELGHELVESRSVLEEAVGVPVSSIAYPYGVSPPPHALAAVGRTYSAACTGVLARVSEGTDPLGLPRVDAHYLRRPSLFRAAVSGTGAGYLRLRRAGARARRVLVSDHVPPAPA
jgi:peptidoglycan/xylan/chitin deacetylase (PgdA/CDA1 family)